MRTAGRHTVGSVAVSGFLGDALEFGGRLGGGNALGDAGTVIHLFISGRHTFAAARAVFYLRDTAIFASSNPLHPTASPSAPWHIYLIVKLGKCIATKLVKGTGESPSARAVEIPNLL